MNGIELIVISPLNGVVRPHNRVLLTRKFLDGMAMYREFWKGPITVVCEPNENASDNLDNIEVDADAVSFRIVCSEFSDNLFRQLISPKSLVLTSVGDKFNGISRLCREANIPCVYIAEYSLRTRLQIVREYQRNIAHGLWRVGREIMQEIAQIKALSLAAGIQCNGTPTYEKYKSLARFPFLFFDTRIEEGMLSSVGKIQARSAALGSGRPLHLVFSGRLKLMKGVDDLPLIAKHLRDLGVPFKLSICGDGECMSQLRLDIEKMGLNHLVELRGTLDFKSELVPFISNDADLFVCCHRQGDPSCTYLETMACGVPIVGYKNEALEGLIGFSKVGWAVANGQPRRLAEEIASIYGKPEELASAAKRSLDFAIGHTFEKTFARRIDHLQVVWEQRISEQTLN